MSNTEIAVLQHCRYISKKDKVLKANPPDTDIIQEKDRIVALARTSAPPHTRCTSRLPALVIFRTLEGGQIPGCTGLQHPHFHAKNSPW